MTNAEDLSAEWKCNCNTITQGLVNVHSGILNMTFQYLLEIISLYPQELGHVMFPNIVNNTPSNVPQELGISPYY